MKMASEGRAAARAMGAAFATLLGAHSGRDGPFRWGWDNAGETPLTMFAEPSSRPAGTAWRRKHSATGSGHRRLTLPGLTFAAMVLALVGTVPDARAQMNEVYFDTDTYHVIPGEQLHLTPTLRDAESTSVFVHVRTVDPTGNLNGYEPARGAVGGGDYAQIFDTRAHPILPGDNKFDILAPTAMEVNATPPAIGSPGKYFYVEITKVTTDGKPNSRKLHPRVTIGNPRRITVFIDHTRQDWRMPQLVLNRHDLRASEPAACTNGHVGDEKTFTMEGRVHRVTRNYGPVHTTETYKVQLDRSPGPGKVVSVEVWDPTDLDRANLTQFHHNRRIHGIDWPSVRQGRISIDKTHLTFTEKNWSRAQTLTVNIHCAQHDITRPLPIWHFAFRHNEDKWGYPAHWSNRKGDNSPTNTSYTMARVRVADQSEPAAITSNVDGKLVVDATGSSFYSGKRKMISLEFSWNNPDNSFANDHDDAYEKFLGFRVRLRTVSPAGHPVQERFVRTDSIFPAAPSDNSTYPAWMAILEAKGFVGWVHGRPDPPDGKYEWSVVPVDKRLNEVGAERVTKCVLLTSRAGPNGGRAARIDETADPTCAPPEPTAQDGGICGRTKAVRNAIVGRIAGVNHCRDVTPEHLAALAGTLDLSGAKLSTLQIGDFWGLTSLTSLDLRENQLTDLQASYFEDLTALTDLYLHGNQFTSLPAGIFDKNTALVTLSLRDNRLSVSALPDGIFAKNTALKYLYLQDNPGAPFSPTVPDAGNDQTVATGVQVTLSGTAGAGGPWGDNVSYYWWQVDGPAANSLIRNGILPGGAAGAAPTFTAPAGPRVLHFRLATTPRGFVADRGTGRAHDWVTITVTGGQGSPAQEVEAAHVEAPSCVSDALLADVQEYAGETWRTSPGHVARWSRVLAAFGVDNAYRSNPMTVAEAEAQADRGLKRWVPVVPALTCLAAAPEEVAPEEQPEPAEVQPASPAMPALSLSAGSAVDEGGTATFTVTADPAPQSDLTVAWTVAQSGDYLAAPGAGSRTVVLTAGAASADLAVATVDDAADEADGSVSVTLAAGAGYTVATGSAAVAVRDNDEPELRITAGSGVVEGASASFTISASPVPAAPLDVTLSVGQSGDFAASGETGSRTVTLPVAGSATFGVATVDDGTEEPDGSITATMAAGTGYTVAAAPDHAATVAVSDNDAASSGPTISIADATLRENRSTGNFKVTLSEPVDWPVVVLYATRDSTPVSAVAGQDYLAWKRSWRLRARFRPGQTETLIHVRLYNDSHDEDPETFEMVLFEPDVIGPPGVSVSIADGVAVGTIINSDPMPAAWLARFGRTAAEQALDGIAGRIAASRSAGVQGSFAGQALNLDSGSGSGALNDHSIPGSLAGDDLLVQSGVARAIGPGSGPAFGLDAPLVGKDRFGGGGVQSRSMTGREVLLGSNFTATGETDATGGSFSFWGRAAQASFDGREGTFSLDGESTAAMLGADYARNNWLLGVALLQTSGQGRLCGPEIRAAELSGCRRGHGRGHAGASLHRRRP